MNRVEIKECEICAKPIKAYGSLERRKTKRFCSRICRGKHQTKVGVVIRSCGVCSKEFRVSGSQKTKGFGKYCSERCMGISYRTPTYKENKNEDIRKSWDYTKWRRAIYERDDYTCQDCGERGVRLETDHIKPFALYPELRFELTNGRTLCKPCHQNTKTYGGRSHQV